MRFILAITFLVIACADALPAHAQEVRTNAVHAPVPVSESWSDSHLATLSLDEKVGQLFSVPAHGVYESSDGSRYRNTIGLVEDVGVGGVIFFEGDPAEQVLTSNDLQARATTPLLMSQDAEWGLAMRVDHSTWLPRPMAIGASGDPDLAYLAGYVTGKEALALGVHQVFAPVADVNNNPEHPILHTRSFGEDAAEVAQMVAAQVKGIQDAGAIATLKHFPGHGDTSVDSHHGLPVLPFDKPRLESLELIPFHSGLDAGAMSVMTGHLAFPEIERDPLVPASLSHAITSELLRRDMRFDGLVVTDALNMDGVTENFSVGEIAIRAVEAGADMLLMSEDVYAARDALMDAIESGRLSEARIDESVERILKAKEHLGLHLEASTDISDIRNIVASSEHRAAASVIAQAGVTLLRNENSLLPLSEQLRRVLIVTLGDGRSALEASNGFNTRLRNNLSSGAIMSTRYVDVNASPEEIVAAVGDATNFDVILVPAITYVRTRDGHSGLSDAHRDVVNRLIESDIPVVLLGLGNPYSITGIREPAVFLTTYGRSDASINSAVEALFGQIAVSARLPITIPGSYEKGAGIDMEQSAPRRALAEEVGMRSSTQARIDSLVHASISGRAFPGAAVAVGRAGAVTWMEGYGYHTYERETPVTAHSQFDLASLTKVIATTTAVMKLYEVESIDLDAPLARYLPEFGAHGKENVTVRQIMTHQSGLIPFRPFHTLGVTDREDLIKAIMNEELQYPPGTDTRYSDLGMISLALAIERITGRSFAEYVRSEIFLPLGMHDTYFRETGETDPSVVPTEIDHTFRRRLVQGEVHDEAAWILGGTAGHAGLFSTASDLARFGYMMVNDGKINGKQFLQPETIRLFTTRADKDGSTRALGWDTRSVRGYSSAGTLFGPRSFGHTGFTGTSIWFDPDQKLFVILLTNRVYPTRDNNRHTPVRAELADIVYRSIEGPPELLLLERLKPNLSDQP